jgi:hypothetical protein
MGAEMETGLGRQQEKWTRGENIGLTGILVDFDGSIWLEVKNNGGGACTTLYFEQNHPKVGWIGTRGKPEGFKEAPNASDRMSLQQLRIVHDRIVNHNDRSVHNAYLWRQQERQASRTGEAAAAYRIRHQSAPGTSCGFVAVWLRLLPLSERFSPRCL